LKKIIYIMGAGRSGTTVLDIILGNAEGVFSCGELTRYPELNGVPHDYPETSETYRFWSDFEGIFKKKSKGTIDYRSLYALYRKFDHHDGFVRNYFGLHSVDDQRRYQQYSVAFFDTLFELSGKDVLVDSSKYPNRALTLSALMPYDLYFIYLVRNPAGVARSFQKKNVEQPSRGWLSSSIYYFVVNAACALVKKRLQRSFPVLLIKYEDLMTDPVGTLEKIQNTCGIALTRSIELVQEQQPLAVGCLFDGNRLRLKKHITLKGDDVHGPHRFKDRMTLTLNYFWWR